MRLIPGGSKGSRQSNGKGGYAESVLDGGEDAKKREMEKRSKEAKEKAEGAAFVYCQIVVLTSVPRCSKRRCGSFLSIHGRVRAGMLGAVGARCQHIGVERVVYGERSRSQCAL